jgi:hypothetical protein
MITKTLFQNVGRFFKPSGKKGRIKNPSYGFEITSKKILPAQGEATTIPNNLAKRAE